MSRVDDRREYERVAYERDRDRRGDEHIRYEDDDLAYTNSSRRPAPPPTRLRERSPSPLARGRGSERTFEDEERFLRERRYFEEEDDIDSVILPSSARRRQHPPPVIPSDFDREVTVDREKLRVREDERSPPRQRPPRPGQMVRRQSSLDTFDRRPARRAYDYERLEDNREHRGPRTGVPIPLPRRHPRESSVERTSERFAKRDEGHGRESSFTSEFDELRIEPGRYRPPPSDMHPLPRPADDHERDYFRETEVLHTRREEESRSRSRESRRSRATRARGRTGRSSSVSSEETEVTNAGRNEYPKKGKTRIPARLVSERALVDLRYPFIKEGNTIVVQVALGQDNIDDVLRLSRDYKKSESEVVESKKTKIKTSSGGEIFREERRREEYYTTPAVYQPAPPPPPPPAPAAPVYAPAPVYDPAPEHVAMAPTTDYTSIKIRDVSPARNYTTSAFSTVPVASTELVRTRSRSRPPAVIVDAGGPVVDYREQSSVGPLAVVAINDRHRHKHRHSRSHSHGDGALYARIHDNHDHHDHRYYYEERDYYERPSRELVRTERLSNGDVVLYEEDIEVEVPRHGVRIEKDKKGGVSTNGLDQHAISLVNDLVTNRRRAKALGRPLIFVAHSLGGIVCKEAVLRSKSPPPNGAHFRDIYESLSAVAFLGTPHRGAWQAKWASIFVSALGFFVNSTNDKLLKVLKIGNELNERTNDNFSGALDEKRNENKAVQVTCFFEEMTMEFGGVIVERASASLDNALPIGIHANHSDMVKFATPEDTGFTRLSGELERWVEDIDPEQDRIRIMRTKGNLMNDVCEWVFDNGEFKTWNDAPQKQCLWIRGDPGKGKTMLMSGIIARFTKEQRPVSYFFCQATDDRLNNAPGVLFGLLYCLLIRKPCLISHLRPTYEIQGRKMFDGVNAWDTLASIFTEMCCDEDAQDVVFLIDALDECRTGNSELLQLIATTHNNIRWIVSSRNELGIEEGMADVGNIVPLKLELNQRTVSAAVGTYIRRKVDKLAKTKSYTDKVKRDVHKYLSENAQGTFLWVALVCEVLSTRPGWRYTETDMQKFPPGLSALYETMMANLVGRKDDVSMSLDILKTVATAFRPLSLHELAMLLYPDKTEPDITLLEESVKLCSSFVTVGGGIVYFVHQSAKDYLSNGALDKNLHSSASNYHRDLCVAALTALMTRLVRDSCQLLYPGTLTEDIEPHQKTPLAPIQYVCLFWAEHLEKSHQLSEHDISQLESTISKFLQTKYLQWLEAMSLLGAVPSLLRSMRTLKTTSQSFSGETAALVQDAYELVFEFRYVIGIAPLQVYASALLFCPSENRVRKYFQAEEPDWITAKPFIKRRQEEMVVLEGHTSGISAINISSDGRYLVSTSYDVTLKIWDMETFVCTRTIKLAGPSSHVAISTGGTHAGVVLDDGVAIVWDVRTNKSLRKFSIVVFGEKVQCASFSPCLQRLTVFYETAGKVWDMESAECVRTEQFGRFVVRSEPFALGGQYVLISTTDNTWIKCGLDLESWVHIGSGLIDSGEISSDGRLLAVKTGASVAVWDLTSSRKILIPFLDSPVRRIIGFTSNDHLIILRDNGSLDLISAKTGKCTGSINFMGGPQWWLTPDGRRLLHGEGNNLTIQDVNDTQSENQTGDPGDSTSFLGLKYDLTLDGSHLVTASGNHIQLWDTASMVAVQQTTISNRHTVRHVLVSPGANRVVLVVDGGLLIWDPAIDNTQRQIGLPGHHAYAGIIWDTTPARHDETLDNYNEVKTSSYERGELQIRARSIFGKDTYSLDLRPAMDESETSAYHFDPNTNWITSDNERLLYIPEKYQQYSHVLRGQVLCLFLNVDEILTFRFGLDTRRFVSPPATTDDLAIEREFREAIKCGDSYSQTGFNYTQTQPSKSNPLGNPGYPGWTSSNGPNWVGYLTTKYNASSLLTYNFAYGGATVDSDLVAPYKPTVLSVKSQVLDEFVTGYTSNGPSKAPQAPGAPQWHGNDSLFAIWVGINDVGNSFSQGAAATATLNRRIFDVYSGLVNTLYTAGARNFVFLTVPPVNRSPLAVSNGKSSQALEKEDIAAFNALLKTDLASDLQAKNSGANVWVIDTAIPFNAVLDAPSVFPQTAGIKNTTGFCEAYANGTPAQDTYKPECSVPVNQYFWLNSLHPTYPIHDVVAEQVAKTLVAGPNIC
ncbi:hypothetical protein F503_04308 [Ophiostoma piceae UAMH 11346]|uniref:Uncharacterized protein n=1 Tax=Ophiostoma piceae (strain UAMH 11346) TaxID=1262450 RepID=S3C9Z3_OPHP1|nr:hypothetical protein F503_04308 [Ophiostoma piceae UAMH 11346]